MTTAKIATPPPPAGSEGLALVFSPDGLSVQLVYKNADGTVNGSPALGFSFEGDGGTIYFNRPPVSGEKWAIAADGRLHMAT